MFGKFYSYLIKILIGKRSIWIVNGLLWLFFSLVLFVIPGSLNLNPLYLWGNSFFNFNLMTIIFLSIYCGILAVQIFNQPKEDGSDLLIFSKPISRNKIIYAKFLVFLTFIGINCIIDMIIPLFCLCWGTYDATSNPKGMDLSKLFSLEASIFIGIFVVSLFYGSIAILVSLKADKPVIMATVTCLATVLHIFATVLPITIKNPSNIATDKYGITIKTSNYYDRYKRKERSFMTLDDGVMDDDHIVDMPAWELNYDAQKDSHLQVVNSFDIASQMASLFKLGELEGKRDYYLSPYGNNTALKFNTKQKDQIFLDEDPKIDASKADAFTPGIYPRKIDGYWTYNIFGVDQLYYSIYSAVGCTPTSIFILENTENKLQSTFVEDTDLPFCDANGKNWITESGTSEKDGTGCQQYGNLRNKIIDYINNAAASDEAPTEESVKADILKFLCSPITIIGKENKTFAYGIEAVIGKTKEEITEADFNLAFGKVSMNLNFDLWDYMYGKNLNKMWMSKEKFENKNLMDRTSDYYSTIHPDKWEGKWTNDEFFSKFRFLFYKDFLDQSWYGNNGIKSSPFDRFSLVMNTNGILLKNIDGCQIPTDWNNPQYTNSSTYQLNTMWNKLNSISELRSATWYTVDRYVPNNTAIAIWTTFSIFLFAITFVIYKRTDIK